ncbi:MAG TPA: MFS transporter [Verrucomicrobiae bacterium]
MSTKNAKSNTGKWMALLAAILGWLFDGFEMGLFPLIGQPALKELLGEAAAGDAGKWFSIIIAVFLIGAATGGVLFGWLGDRIGRVKAMSLSIFTYAIFTGLCGFATEAWHIAALRFIASLGMGGEWSLGVALVNEIWPGKSRAIVAGLIGAAANVGFLMVAFLSMGLIGMIESIQSGMLSLGLSQKTVEYLLHNSAWRFLMISGAFPALLIFMIRLFVPESEKWEEEKEKGGTSHWATQDLIGVLIGCVGALVIIYVWSPAGPGGWIAGLVTLIGLAIALVGYLYPVKRYLERAMAAGSMTEGGKSHIIKMMVFGAALAGVALLGTWGALQWAPRWAIDLAGPNASFAKEWTQVWSSLGAIVGTILAAVLCDYFGRRPVYAFLCAASLAAAYFLYRDTMVYGNTFLFAVFLAGSVSAAFYGWFPLYLPELYPTSVRATGQGFAFNFGRILAAVGGLQTATLMKHFDGSFPAAAKTMALIYVVGVIVVWFGPETKGKPLPE